MGVGEWEGEEVAGEVKAEQFSTVGVEVWRGMGVEGEAGERAGIKVVKETVNCPRPGPYPQSSMALLSLIVIPNRKWGRVLRVFSRGTSVDLTRYYE